MWLPLFEIANHYRMGSFLLPLCGQYAVRQLSVSCHFGLMLAPIAHESCLWTVPQWIELGPPFGRHIIRPTLAGALRRTLPGGVVVCSPVVLSFSHTHDNVIMYTSDATDATDTHTESHTQTYTDTDIHTHTHRQTRTHKDTHTDTHTHRHTDRVGVSDAAAPVIRVRKRVSCGDACCFVGLFVGRSLTLVACQSPGAK